MKRSNVREESIDSLTVEQLRERLRAAEEVCVYFGWSPSRERESDVDRLVAQAWTRWLALAGINAASPFDNARLSAILHPDRRD